MGEAVVREWHAGCLWNTVQHVLCVSVNWGPVACTAARHWSVSCGGQLCSCRSHQWWPFFCECAPPSSG